MILLLGASGYIAQAFIKEMNQRGIPHLALSRNIRDYTNPNEMNNILSEGFDLVINCAVFIPGTAAKCNDHPNETIAANIEFPHRLSRECHYFGIPLAHISTACQWSDGQEHSEQDPPQRAFNGYCGFYVGSKVMSEWSVSLNCPKHYIWRIRLPFDEFDNDRNYISKLAQYEQVWKQTNSLCHRADIVKACLDMWNIKAEFGTYHIANSGSICSETIVHRMMDMGIIKTLPQLVEGQPGSTRLSVKKLLATGIKIRPVEEAIEESLKLWKPRS